MIIDCPYCEKKFEIDQSLIPEKGRLLQCGSCQHTWFFNRKQIDQSKIDVSGIEKKPAIKQKKKVSKKATSRTEKVTNKSIDQDDIRKEFEIIEYKSKSNFTFNKFLSYIIVFIISFIGFLIIVDTFKVKLYEIFPKLEILIFNLFETLKDIILFVKDLF